MGWRRLFDRKEKKRKEGFRLEAAVPEEEITSVRNPGRGWYQLYSFVAHEGIVTEELKWSIDEADTLALVIIDIGAYREESVSEQGLENIRAILDFFAKAKKDMILRIVYDREGKGLEKEPAFFSQIIEHIRQLSPMIKEYEKNILTFQGVLVGSWGEMHSSRYLSEERLCTLAQELWEGLGGSCPLAVRRPVYWRMLEQEWENREGEAYPGPYGLFDDAMFASDTHLGTFGEEEGRRGWTEPWGVGEELAFENWLGDYVLCGGEAVAPQLGEEVCQNGGRITERLQQMHITYLNRVYDEKLLTHWKEINCGRCGIWEEVSCYDYVGSHLGYRFVIRGVRLASEEQDTLLEIEIENCGFAGIFQEAEVWLEVEENGKSRSIPVDCDVKKWKSGMVSKVLVDLGEILEKGEEGGIGVKGSSEENRSNKDNRQWKLYLRMKRKWDGQRILFGNRGEGDGRVLLGDLGVIKKRL